MKDNAEVHVANCTVQINYHTVPLLQACIALITLIDKRHLDSILGIASVFQNAQLIHPHTPLPQPSISLALSILVIADTESLR